MTPFKKYFTLGPLAIFLLAGCGAVFVNKGSKDEPLTDGLKNPADMVAKLTVPSGRGERFCEAGRLNWVA